MYQFSVKNNEKNFIVFPKLEDIKVIENLSIRRVAKKDKNFKNIVPKPWGFEYLCGKNKHVEIWELYIKSGATTSLHCHPDKDTLNIILEGEAEFETSAGVEKLTVGEFRLIKSGAIHRTLNLSKQKLRLIEIECPPDKYNLIRVSDKYGRENVNYEIDRLKTRNYKKRELRYLNYSKYLGQNENRVFIPKTTNNSTKILEMKISSLCIEKIEKSFRNILVKMDLRCILVTNGKLLVHAEKKIMPLFPGDYLYSSRLRNELDGLNFSSKGVSLMLW